MAFAAKRTKPATTHKKRSGKHRKHSEQYLKHYWPYLPLLAIVAAGLLCNMLWPNGARVLGARSDLSVQTLQSETNEARRLHHEPALALNAQLSQAAQAKALDMVAGNYWSHTTPDGKAPWSFITTAGYQYATAGENLAYGLNGASDTVRAWMHSPEHRQNILDVDYQQVGFGVATAPDYLGKGPETIIVAMYASPATYAIAQPNPNSAVAGEVKGASTATASVSRVALLGGAGSELPTLLIATMIAAVVLTVLRHGRLLHRSIVRGERFVLRHPFVDVLAVLVIVVGILLTRTAGFIL